MKVTKNRLDLMDTVTVDGVQEKDPLTLEFRDFELLRSATWHRTIQTELKRPDLISNEEYRTPGFWWFILAVNGIVDPYDLPQSENFRIPQLLDYYDWYRGQKGRRS